MEHRHLLSAAALIACLTADIASAHEAAPFVGGAPSARTTLAVTARPVPSDDDSSSEAEGDARPVQGLYVRGGLGFGGMGNNVISVQENAEGEVSEGTVTGTGLNSEITVGAAAGRDWVLGGGIWNALIFTTDYTHVQGDEIPEGLQRPTSMTLVGGLATWHFAPRLGLYAQGGVGLAVVTSRQFAGGDLDGSTSAFGPGLTLGIGADFWVDDAWALGVIARMNAAAAIERERGERYVHGVVAPALLMTVAYNE